MIAQHVADGLLTGAIIAMGAIGVTLSMSILRFANFAHSELLTSGAYAALALTGFFGLGAAPLGPLSVGWPFLGALAGAAAVTAALAIGLDGLVFGRMRRAGAARLSLIFASFGLALVLRNLIVLLFGAAPDYYTRELQIADEVWPGVRIMPDQVLVVGLTLVLVALLWLFLDRTRMGLAMRAVSENPVLAGVSGVDVAAVIRWTWALSGALAGVAGVFLGLTVQLRPEMGFNLLLPLFAAAILGGSGSVGGAVVGGFIIGLAENLSVIWISPGYKAAAPFFILLTVLAVRPRGLWGKKS